MFCRKCGIKILDNSTFCPECGEKINTEENLSTEENIKPAPNQNTPPKKPFREDFYKHIKGVSFLSVAIFALIYYGVNIMNSVLHFNPSEIFVSVISILYGLIAFGLIVPAMWMLFLDRSPHSAFVPLKLYAFINLLKIFLITAFGTLTVLGATMGKGEISKEVLYLADQTLSLYLVTLISQTAKHPSMMLLFTSGILWTTYLTISLMYHISLIRFANSTSKKINNNETVTKGYTVISSLSFFISVISFIYALSMYLYLKDDIYNILLAVFKGLFHLMVFFDLRKFGRMFAVEEEADEEKEE